MPQITPTKGPSSEIGPSQELIERVFRYINSQRPCYVRDVIEAMRQFFPDNTERAEVKIFVVKALNILTNKENKVFVGVIAPHDTELSVIYTLS